jgi:hypothetical protein
MLKVVFTNKATGITEESLFNDQAQFDAHQIEFPQYATDYTFVFSDVTAEVDHAKKVYSRESVRVKCLELIDEIAALNLELQINPATVFSNSAFQGICLALLTGAPQTASQLIVQNGPSIYPQSVVDEFVAKLAAM